MKWWLVEGSNWPGYISWKTTHVYSMACASHVTIPQLVFMVLVTSKYQLFLWQQELSGSTTPSGSHLCYIFNKNFSIFWLFLNRHYQDQVGWKLKTIEVLLGNHNFPLPCVCYLLIYHEIRAAIKIGKQSAVNKICVSLDLLLLKRQSASCICFKVFCNITLNTTIVCNFYLCELKEWPWISSEILDIKHGLWIWQIWILHR